MSFNPEEILSVLDRCAGNCQFPALDNGYIYLAATRLSLFRSMTDWALVFEVFGYSPRADIPHTSIQTFASKIHARKPPASYVKGPAYDNYLKYNPHNDSHYVYPLHDGPWLDWENAEFVSECAENILVRDQSIPLPNLDQYAPHGIELQEAPQIQIFELCRFLADIARELVLATAQERRVNVLPDIEQILQLEEWHHPDIVEGESPGGSETFQQLAQVLATGDVGLYRPTEAPNTHWRNWPLGGTL